MYASQKSRCLEIINYIFSIRITHQGQNYGTSLDHETYQMESGHNFDDSHNFNQDQLSNTGNQPTKTTGFSRALPPPIHQTSLKWWRY